MNMIRKIFLDDMKHLLRNFFVLVIILGVSVLPALYAWLNIYSNWDPYGNTQNLTLAAVSLDRDYITEDQKAENTGDKILENLKTN
ncbi:MAG: YhgE/Pip domain-containing protein, partial [Lachnospiraceae bacterium]|nr:YhgE/Pip domain-containing protein [Lachnospiraceae bacterium]